MLNLVGQARKYVAACDVKSLRKNHHPGRTTSRLLLDENSTKQPSTTAAATHT